jgi:hypothetical protein
MSHPPFPHLAVLLFAWPGARVALAQADGGPLDSVEHLLGPTNVNAALGDGNLTVGVAKTGEITVLRWPGPGGSDHVRYQTKAISDPNITARTLPYFGATADDGAFWGVVFNGATSWSHDPPWTREQIFAGEYSPVLVTTFEQAGGLKVVQEDFVAIGQDLFVRNLRISGVPGNQRIIFYAALAPCGPRSTGVPVDDWYYDEPRLEAAGSVDFAAFYDGSHDAVLQLRPEESQVSCLRSVAATQETATLANSGTPVPYDNLFGPGIYLAWSASQPSAGHSVARMSYPMRPQGLPPPPYEDASTGQLTGAGAGTAPAAGALAYDVVVPSSGEVTLTLYLAAASSAEGAFALLEGAKQTGEASLRSSTESDWSGWIHSATLPAVSDPTKRITAQRALMNIRTGVDHTSGAIVASISTQPPYAEDWPRDSAFLNWVLDRAGFLDLATANAEFLAKVQRRSDEPGEPSGSFAMNYYPDGRPGGPIPFEIDNTAFAVFTFEAHAQALEKAGHKGEAMAFRSEVFPALELAANLLTTCKDPNGLQCPANEDDNFAITQTLHGAATVYLAMQYATQAAEAMGKSDDQATWSARAEEIRGAILANFVDDNGLLIGTRGARAWALWPAGLYPQGDPHIGAEADRMLADLDAATSPQPPGSTYDGKLTSALAIVLQGDKTRFAALETPIDRLMTQIPTSTSSYGEVYVFPAADGTPTYENRVAIPHLWEGALNYLAAVNYYGARSPGCGCGADGGAQSAAGLLLLSGLSARRRRRSRVSARTRGIFG